MNSPSHRNLQADEPLQQPVEETTQEDPHYTPDAPPLRADEYDPVWTAENEVGRSEAIAQSELDRLEQIISAEQKRMRRRLASEFLPPPPPVTRKRTGLRWAVGTFAFLLTGTALIVIQTTGKVPLLDEATGEAAKSRLAAMLAPASQQPAPATQASLAPAAAPVQQPARLVVTGSTADNAEQILIGIAAENASLDMTAVVSGLEPGTVLSAGKPWGSTGWIVPASELATTYLKPPAGFSGKMEYTVALHRVDNSVVDRQTMRLEWSAPNAQAPAPSQQQPVASAPPAAHAPTQSHAVTMSQQEIDLMVARGTELLNQGDIASARLLLQHAAEARDARAALALAASYDPNELKRLGVYGAEPDIAQAREWYEKARQFGSREAPRRLELLASQFR